METVDAISFKSLLGQSSRAAGAGFQFCRIAPPKRMRCSGAYIGGFFNRRKESPTYLETKISVDITKSMKPSVFSNQLCNVLTTYKLFVDISHSRGWSNF